VQHVIRPIHAEGARVTPIADAIEWMLRLLLMLFGAVLVGSGLAGNATALAGVLRFFELQGAADTLVAAWSSPSAVWYQLGSVFAGFSIIAIAALPVPGLPTRPGLYLFTALAEPLKDFLARYRGTAALILALICAYRLSDFVLNIMNPFYLDLGFTLIEVAEVRTIFGVVATMLGVFAAGVAVARLGVMPALLIGAFSGPLSNLVFIWLAMQGHDLPSLFVAISIDNVLGGFAGTCLIAYMSSLTAAGFTATQYALFSSLYALPGRIIASQSGRIVESAAQSAENGGPFSGLSALFSNLPPESFAQAMEKSGVSPRGLAVGYTVFFMYSALIGIAGIILAFVVAAREKRREDPRIAPAAGAAQPPARI
jgi:PAT family beta-lactamase induction signal transducer AmpG